MNQGGYRLGGKYGTRASLGRAGFTIVETLIVLAVTSALFTAVAITLTGKQSRTMFSTSVNDLRQEIQQTINETVSGYYPNQGSFSCSRVAGSPAISPVLPTAQGTNGDCIFVGKVLYFGSANGTTAMTVIPMAGNRLDSTLTRDVESVNEARPVAIAPGSTPTTNPLAPNLAIDAPFQGGLTYAWHSTGGGTSTTDYAIGVLRNFEVGADQSGSDQFGLYGYLGGASGWNTGDIKQVVSAMDQSALYRVTYTLTFCMASGTSNQSGLFHIDQSLHVTVDIKENLTCA